MRTPVSLAVFALLVAGCGPQHIETPAPVRPTAPAPTPVASPATPATASPAAPASAATSAALAATRLPVVFDPAAADALARVTATGQDAAAAAITLAGGGIEFALAADAPWPGIAIRPPGPCWDLTGAGGIEAVIDNLGQAPLQIGLRVDQQGGGANDWNGENLRLEPGKSGTVTVVFGRSWGRAGFALDPARVGRVQVYGVKPGPGSRLRLRSLAAVSRQAVPSNLPAPVAARRPPGVPQVVSFAAGVDPQLLRASGATVAASAGAARITLAAAQAEVTVRPPRPYDLRDFRQATCALRNPGANPLTVTCRLIGSAPDDQAVAEATLAAGESRDLLLPFAAARPWRGVTPAKDGKAGGQFLGAPTEQTSAGLVNDAVSKVVLTVRGKAGAVLEWSGLTAAAGAPAVVPAWVGTRPPVPGDWVQTLAEDFDGSALDLARWTPRLPWIGPIPYELQCYVERNVQVRQGNLVIRCTKEDAHLYDNPAWPERHYATGVITSYDKWSWRYGYAEARMKLPRALGLWPAFWTMPDRGPLAGAAATAGDWQARWEAARSNPDKNRRRSTDADGMEFDIMEHCTRFGPFRHNVAAHWDGYGKDHRSVGTSRIYFAPDADGWIVSGLLWEPGRLTWYCNGQEVGSWADERVGSVPASLKFTVQMGGWAGKEVDDSALPDEFRVDWVRVWQLRERLGSASAAAAR